MKRILATTVASLMLFCPLAGMASAEQYGQGPQNHQQQDQNQSQAGDRHDDRRDDGARNDNGRRHDGRHRWRDDRRDARWDDNQHNGYYQNGRWYYGPPPEGRYGQRGFALGYQPWTRGQRLGYYQSRYHEVDYRSHHLRAPRRGYHWVQDDRGDYLLAAIATGVIAAVILNSR